MKIWRWLFGKKQRKHEENDFKVLQLATEKWRKTEDVLPLPEAEKPKPVKIKPPVKSKIVTTMTSQEKKDLIRKRINEGDKRSWYQIAADLELQLWTEKHS